MLHIRCGWLRGEAKRVHTGPPIWARGESAGSTGDETRRWMLVKTVRNCAKGAVMVRPTSLGASPMLLLLLLLLLHLAGVQIGQLL